MVADIPVNKKSGKITATHLYVAQDTGFTVSPGLVENQMSGSAIMGLSRALFEQLTFTRSGHEPRLGDLPDPEVRGLTARQRDDRVAGGQRGDHPGADQANIGGRRGDRPGVERDRAGEPGAVSPAPLVAKTLFDATGVRIREAPMTSARVRTTLKAAGAAI